MTWWEAHANQGIIGLPRRPAEGYSWWPSEGYDGALCEYHWEALGQGDVLGFSGHTREQWLLLGDEMVERWREWVRYIEGLP